MNLSCSICESIIHIWQHTLMTCRVSNTMVISSAMGTAPDQTTIFILEATLGQSEKISCDKCSCCKIVAPGHLLPFEMPKAGSSEEREILLKHGLKMKEEMSTLETNVNFLQAKAKRLDGELNDFIKDNALLQKRIKLLETSLADVMANEGLNGGEQIVRLHEKLDNLMIENVSLTFDVDSIQDYCDMLLRRQEEMEAMMTITLAEMNSGKFSSNGNVHIVELNCAEVKLAGLVLSNSVDSSSSSEIEEMELCKENYLRSIGKASDQLLTELKQEKFLRKMLKKKYSEAQEQLENLKESIEELKIQLKTAQSHLEDALQQQAVIGSSPGADYNEWENYDQYENWETNTEGRYPPI